MINLPVKVHIDTCIKLYYMYVTILTYDGKPMFTKVSKVYDKPMY
jgi:hypothetical protein